ncbi:hypothetical protein ABGB12_26025 [Actinocorallia sp. B10E7]|uniref:TetR/AcrR family transcriptional regulator n=1 Tax=Actinocorallia sp. B10E7 TaxID=3153558 RepID=UPI00325F7C07
MEERPEQRTLQNRLNEAALPIFANMGYDSTDNEMIANAAGVSRQEVIAAGGRRRIYLSIVEDFYRAQLEMLDEVAASFVPDEAGIHMLLERMMEFYLDHPDEMALWQQRYLHDAADIADIEAKYRVSVFQRTADIFGPELTSRADLQILANITSWSFRGFMTEGIIQIGGGPILRPEDPEGRARFRSYLHYMTKLLFDGAGQHKGV